MNKIKWMNRWLSVYGSVNQAVEQLNYLSILWANNDCEDKSEECHELCCFITMLGIEHIRNGHMSLN